MLKPIITMSSDIQNAYFNIVNAKSIQWCVIQACDKSREHHVLKLIPKLDAYLLEIGDTEEKLKNLYDMEQRNQCCIASVAMRAERALRTLDEGFWLDVIEAVPNYSLIANETDIKILDSLHGIKTLIHSSVKFMESELSSPVNIAA